MFEEHHRVNAHDHDEAEYGSEPYQDSLFHLSGCASGKIAGWAREISGLRAEKLLCYLSDLLEAACKDNTPPSPRNEGRKLRVLQSGRSQNTSGGPVNGISS
jgi:hypothetical protein